MAGRDRRMPRSGRDPGNQPTRITAQVSPTLQSATNTAAEPMSLARPASSWISGPYRSITASIAEFSSSKARTASTLPIRSARSTAEWPSRIAAGSATTAATTSSRNEDSCSQADRSPWRDQRSALKTRAMLRGR
uniref:Uncharacterized protein n=1 Tax=Strongyloides venezuelensis TaxID=75913 RepID=A0A0K0FWG4_STRVS